MAKRRSKQSQRPAAARPAGRPRRLGEAQNRPASQGATRRAARRTPVRTSRYGWVAIGLVVVIVAVFVIIKVTSNTPKSTSGDSAGRNPALASAALVTAVTTVPASVYESIGTAAQTVPFTSTSGQPAITTTGNSLPTFVYEGAEYCPYCAMMRWSMVAALSRFGTFSGLKVTSSADDDYNIPTFSFLGSHYTSKYLNFTSYEFEDRNQNPLQKLTTAAQGLESKYGYPPFASSQAESGIPFMDFNNKFVTSGDPNFMVPMIPFLQNGGPGSLAIGQAIHNPASTVGQAIQSKDFIIEANFITAAICSTDGKQPAAVCSSPMMQKTIASLNALKTVS